MVQEELSCCPLALRSPPHPSVVAAALSRWTVRGTGFQQIRFLVPNIRVLIPNIRFSDDSGVSGCGCFGIRVWSLRVAGFGVELLWVSDPGFRV